jgi:hypothetical protein
MIPIDPPRPAAPSIPPLRVHRVNPTGVRKNSADLSPKQRRKRRDRRTNPFCHRGPFEMRSGVDRRDYIHIDEEV